MPWRTVRTCTESVDITCIEECLLLPSLSSVVFDGLGDVMKPTVTPQAGDVDTSMANMASSK